MKFGLKGGVFITYEAKVASRVDGVECRPCRELQAKCRVNEITILTSPCLAF